MKKFILFAFQLLMAISLLTSCTKEEGEGGKGSTIGTVYKVYDDGEIIQLADGSFSFVRDTVLAKDEDVYIIYGDNEYGYSDKTSTSLNGTFKFEFLTDGNYTVYTLSDLASGEKVPNIYTVNISDGNEVYAGDFYVTDGKNNGKCGIVGQIQAQYKDASTPINGVGLRIFCQKVGSQDISDTRSDANGMFAFAKLEPNSEYIIFAENEPYKNEGIIAQSISITTGGMGSITPASTLSVSIY